METDASVSQSKLPNDELSIELDLSGPSKARRLARLRALLQDESIDSKVIEIAISIENVPANITEYRDRERFLENLLKALRQDKSAQSERTQVVIFRHLVGSLYVNFEKFWGPTVRVIIELLNQTQFQIRLLNILLNHLKDTNDIIYDESRYDVPDTTEDRPDHILHRNFVFQLLAKFTQYVESNNVAFMDEFFRFVHKELLVSPFIEKFTRDDLTGKNCDLHGDTLDDILLDDEEIQMDSTAKKGYHKKRPLPASLLQKRKSRESFITVAKIIQSFENIGKVHRQSELRELILDLLCCRDGSVQRASFNCLIAYDHSYLKPYVNQILKIMNDKMVRTELTMFSIDADESDQIQLEHRKYLMPIILRILFGKMIGRIGRKSSGRDKADLRKTLVMRFIAGCTTDEVMYFFALLFDPIFRFIDAPYEKLEEVLSNDCKLNNYVPLNKLQAMLNSLTAYIESVAHLKEDSLHCVFKLINIITYQVLLPLENQELLARINGRNVDSLKVLRRGCLNIAAEFFRMFEYYSFQQQEINFMFKHLIWTSTSGFIDRNYANPTPMLKLIESFASNRVYHQLLIKRNKIDREEYLLNHIISLYVNEKTHRPIIRFVASILAAIIGPDSNSDPDEEQRESHPTNLMFVDEDAIVPEYDKTFYKLDKDLELNQEILIGFIPIIFERLKRSCEDFLEKKDADHRIENDELIVLSALSGYLKDPEQSLLGSRLLLTTLDHQNKGELILNTLKTVQVLLKQVKTNTDPEIVPIVANILSYQRNLKQREELCNLIDCLALIDSHLVDTAKIVRLMNSTFGEYADTPDLVKWNEGFSLAFKYIEELDQSKINQPEVVRDSFTILLHQTGFIINSVDRYEFSIRENCMVFYEKFAMKLKLMDVRISGDLANSLLNDILLDRFIKKGLRDTNDLIKHTYIGILRSLAINCHEKNKTLSEFFMFCSDNLDLDFWHNIRSIQLHSRSKALARLVADEKIHKVSPRTLSSYFMPLATGFLFSKAYKSVASLVDNSIKLIGLICRHLNWVTYESTLSYYLGLLTKANATYQRTNIKLITEILKNFNFDIVACKEAMENEKENAKLEKRMMKRRGKKIKSDGEVGEVITTDAPSGKRLNPSTARMVYFSVTKKLIPRLESSLHEMTRVEFEHDKNMADYLPEKEEIKRIPMAFAIVQLLNLLPGRYILFRDHLPSLFLKLSSFLRSKNEDVRKAARSTIIKVMNFVGPAYMPDLLRTLKQNLDKGFQIHVLNYTIHSVLEKLPLKYGDLDCCVSELVNSCFQEIFGKLSEDKEIAQILAKTFEAKKTKSYDTLLILSSYISAEKLDYLMNSIKETLKTSNEPRKVNKLAICLQKVFTGLAKNSKFPPMKLLAFIQATIEESIPSLRVRQVVDQVEGTGGVKLRTSGGSSLREDRYLIAKDMPRDRIKSRINEKGNLHMIVENCLRLLLHTFETNKVIIRRNDTHKEKLDGFIGLLSICLKSSSPKCVMRALKCIYFIAQSKADLPSFKTKCNSIVRKIFILLSLYNGVGMVRGDNFEMIGMCFKTITLLLLHCEHVKLDETQVRALMSYIEQDLHDDSRQATAFGTLHSLLKKNCNSPELVDIMVKVADLLVTSEDSRVRSLSIGIWETYLLDYKHDGDMLQAHLTKFLRQLDYEFMDGRKSVLKILTIVVSKFPERLLRNYFELMFQLLSQRIVNDDSKEVRGIVARLIGLLIQRLPDKQVYLFNKFVLKWASQPNTELKLLGVKLISIFIESCKSILTNDRGKIKSILTVVEEGLEHEQIELETRDSVEEENELNSDADTNTGDVNESNKCGASKIRLVTSMDKLNYHLLRLFKRLLSYNLISPIESRNIDHLEKIWHNIASKKLCNWHLPIVLTSCELYLIFLKETDLAVAIDVQNPSTDDYLCWNAKRIVRTLCDKYVELLDRADQSNQLLAYISESMIILGQLIADSRATHEFESEYSSKFTDRNIIDHLLNLDSLPNNGFIQEHLPCAIGDAKEHPPRTIGHAKKQVNLMWIAVKVVMQAKKEAALYRLSKYHRRDFVLKWSAAVLQVLGAQRVNIYALLFIMTPIRELTDKGKSKSSDNYAQQNTIALSEDLLKFIKSLMGVEIFNKLYSRVQLHYTRKRLERKKKEAIIKIKDQARGVKRKMKQSMTKKNKRRRKNKLSH